MTVNGSVPVPRVDFLISGLRLRPGREQDVRAVSGRLRARFLIVSLCPFMQYTSLAKGGTSQKAGSRYGAAECHQDTRGNRTLAGRDRQSRAHIGRNLREESKMTRRSRSFVFAVVLAASSVSIASTDAFAWVAAGRYHGGYHAGGFHGGYHAGAPTAITEAPTAITGAPTAITEGATATGSGPPPSGLASAQQLGPPPRIAGTTLTVRADRRTRSINASPANPGLPGLLGRVDAGPRRSCIDYRMLRDVIRPRVFGGIRCQKRFC